MSTHDDAALRAARKQRVAGSGNQSQNPATPVVEPAKTAPKVANTQVTVPTVLSTPVVDPTTVPRTASVSMHLFNENSTEPHWMVCANGIPVAEIRLQDQKEPEKIGRMFVTPEYSQGVIEASKRIELAEVLSGVHARPYMAVVAGSDAFKHIETQARTASAEDMRRARAGLRDSMLNMLGLVVQAQSKNFITENPLKDALFNRLRQAGVNEGSIVPIIEAAWQEKGMEHFEHLFRMASKYLDMSPEALTEWQEMITEQAYRTPVVAAVEPSPRVAAPSAAKNVPLVTYASAGYKDEGNGAETTKDSLREAFGFRSKRR